MLRYQHDGHRTRGSPLPNYVTNMGVQSHSFLQVLYSFNFFTYYFLGMTVFSDTEFLSVVNSPFVGSASPRAREFVRGVGL